METHDKMTHPKELIYDYLFDSGEEEEINERTTFTCFVALPQFHHLS